MKELLSGRSAPGREQAWFALGALLILIHTVDDTIAPGEVDIAPGVIEATAVVAAILYRMLPWFVALLAALFVGITRLVGGVGHLWSLGDPDPGDATRAASAAQARASPAPDCAPVGATCRTPSASRGRRPAPGRTRRRTRPHERGQRTPVTLEGR